MNEAGNQIEPEIEVINAEVNLMLVILDNIPADSAFR